MSAISSTTFQKVLKLNHYLWWSKNYINILEIANQMHPKDAPTNPPYLPNLHFFFCEILVLSEQVHILWNETNENNMLQI